MPAPPMLGPAVRLQATALVLHELVATLPLHVRSSPFVGDTGLGSTSAPQAMNLNVGGDNGGGGCARLHPPWMGWPAPQLCWEAQGVCAQNQPGELTSREILPLAFEPFGIMLTHQFHRRSGA